MKNVMLNIFKVYITFYTLKGIEQKKNFDLYTLIDNNILNTDKRCDCGWKKGWMGLKNVKTKIYQYFILAQSI